MLVREMTAYVPGQNQVFPFNPAQAHMQEKPPGKRPFGASCELLECCLIYTDQSLEETNDSKL
jgi:hypothetical protein